MTPSSEGSAAFEHYAALGIQQARALAALRQSRAGYEKGDEELSKVKGRPALTRKMLRQQVAALEAMAQSALTCARLGDERVALAPQVNVEWQRAMEELQRYAAPTAEQVTKALADTQAARIEAVRVKFELSDAEVAALTASAQHLATGLKEPPARRDVLLDDEWQKATEQMAASHRKLADLYGQLKERLDAATRPAAAR